VLFSLERTGGSKISRADSDWSKMAEPRPRPSSQARNLGAYHTAQMAAKAAHANLSAVPDDNHSAFTLDRVARALVSGFSGEKGAGPVGMRLRGSS